jgi:hypothetical protein
MAGKDMQREWARVGAGARLVEIDRERATILKAFPELRRGGAPKGAVAGLTATGKPKRRFSAAARRRMSAGMRKFWARRKAAAKTKA